MQFTLDLGEGKTHPGDFQQDMFIHSPFSGSATATDSILEWILINQHGIILARIGLLSQLVQMTYGQAILYMVACK